jgi:hypothetical protein
MQTKDIEMAGNIHVIWLEANIDCWNANIKIFYVKVGMEIVAT